MGNGKIVAWQDILLADQSNRKFYKLQNAESCFTAGLINKGNNYLQAEICPCCQNWDIIKFS